MSRSSLVRTLASDVIPATLHAMSLWTNKQQLKMNIWRLVGYPHSDMDMNNRVASHS